jgi:GNAT superfamily N-acetyltransferase
MTGALMQDVVIRRELAPGDAEAIVELHRRIYSSEYGHNERSQEDVTRAMERALERGWPEHAGRVWLVQSDRGLSGALALTLEDDGVGAVHWFMLLAELRGHGLGRSLFAELIAAARTSGLERLELETFSLLTTAARIYRDAGFRLVRHWDSDRWGPLLTIQRYELRLS